MQFEDTTIESFASPEDGSVGCGSKLQHLKVWQKGGTTTMKRLFGTLAVVALCWGVAMAQAGPEGGFAQETGVVMAQAGQVGGFAEDPGPVAIPDGPGGQFIGGPKPSFRSREMIIRTGHGPGMFYRARGMGSWWMNPEVAQRIGLSEQQKQQLEKISQNGQLKMIDLRADLEKQEVILAPMLRTYHPDEAQVLAQVGKVSQARAALEKESVQTMLASRNVLTEEQWNKLQQNRMGFHHRFGPRRGFHRPSGPGMQGHPRSAQ